MIRLTDRYTPEQRAALEQAISDLMYAAHSAGSAVARDVDLEAAIRKETDAYKRLWSLLFLEDDGG